MTTALYWGVPLSALERRCQAVFDPRRCHRHEKPGRCHHFPAYAPGIGNVTDITTETLGDHDETLNRDYNVVSGYRRCPAHRRVGSSCPQTGGDELQAGVGRYGRPASPDLRHLRGGKAHAGRIFRSSGLLRKATVHPGSVMVAHRASSSRCSRPVTRSDGFWRAGLSGLDCRRPPCG